VGKQRTLARGRGVERSHVCQSSIDWRSEGVRYGVRSLSVCASE
jgi:hypothetical protein